MTYEAPQEFSLKCIPVQQPIGTFYIASIDSSLLCKIAEFDVRRMVRERDIETYLGIQRPLVSSRVKELQQYVRTADACFPTAVILAVEGRCARYDEKNNTLVLTNYIETEDLNDAVLVRQIAKVLDGQHRIAGLMNYEGPTFEVNVSIFIDIDIADQAYIFSTVNLAQTKVNRSLAYDLFDLAKARSPQKTCHNIAVALDKLEQSPFFKRIKRLGTATEGRFGETLTQATVVQSLISYLSDEPAVDRDMYLRGKTPAKVGAEASQRLIFRNMFLEERDLDIADVLLNYFSAVRNRWPIAWANVEKGAVLSRTNGFRALARFLRDAYLIAGKPGDIPSQDDFSKLLANVAVSDDYFTTENFKPGTSGEAELYRMLKDQAKPQRGLFS